ncbi:hypothetical protein VKT23_003003 [Stygiomarasmius scandens]|uniref:Uncharacterized protein n=1 Tax=Marasmiellus scandens TaxID=2682957 RepID=A0ABR1K294_9AGAR
MCFTTASTHPYTSCAEFSINNPDCRAFSMFERPEITSYEPPAPEVTCRALIPYQPSPFGSLSQTRNEKQVYIKDHYINGVITNYDTQAPLDANTGALIGFNQNNFIDTLRLAFPNPYIRALLSHAFRDSILIDSLSDDQLRIVHDKYGNIARVFFMPRVADAIWTDFRRLAEIVLTSTKGTDEPRSIIPSSYSKDFLNIEWINSSLSALLPHITFAHGPNPLRSVYAKNIHTMHEVYTIIQFIARRYAQWILEQVVRSVSLGYLSASNWGAYFGLTHDETLTHLTQKSVARLEAEKEICKRREERRNDQKDICNSDDIIYPGLVLHPTESSLGRQGLLTPYTPVEPGWDISMYAPSADITLRDESFGNVFIQAAKEVEMIRD